MLRSEITYIVNTNNFFSVMRSDIISMLNGTVLIGDLINDEIIITTLMEKVIFTIIKNYYHKQGIRINIWSPTNIENVQNLNDRVTIFSNKYYSDLILLLKDLSINIREDCFMKLMVTTDSIFINVKTLS